MFKFLKKDSLIFGIILGAIVPWIVFGLLFAANYFLSSVFEKEYILKDATVKLVSIVLNIFIFRHYLVKEKFEKSGRGVLLITFIYAVLIYIFFMR